MSASAPRWRVHDRVPHPRVARAAAHHRRARGRADGLRPGCHAQALARCLPGRHQRPGPDRHRGAGPLARGGRALCHRAHRDGHDRSAGHGRAALAEQAGPVADHPGVHRRDRRVLRAPAGHGAADRDRRPHAARHHPGAGAGVHRPRRGLPVHPGAHGRRQPGADRGRADRAPHRAGLGGAAAAALHPRHRRDQLPGRLREAVPGAGRAGQAALPRPDHPAGLPGPGQQQRQLGRRRAAALRRAVPDPRRRPGQDPGRHRRHRAEVGRGHAGACP